MKPFSERMPRLGTENAFSVINKAKKFEKEILAPKGEKLIYLQIGEPGFDTPKNINEAAVKAIEKDMTHYTPTAGIPELRKAVAEYSSKNACDNGIESGKKNALTASSGSKRLNQSICSLHSSSYQTQLIPIHAVF